MTPTTQPESGSEKFDSPLTPQGMEVVSAAQNIIYDKQSVEQIEQALNNTKSKEAIAPTVAMFASALLKQMGPKFDEVEDDEKWGKNGIVHIILTYIFEVAKELGFNAPGSDLKVAYQIVEEQIDGQQSQGDPMEQGGGMGQESMSMDGGMAQSQMRPLMGGAMPGGM